MSPRYAGVEQLRDRLTRGAAHQTTTSNDDADYAQALDAASELIDDYCGRNTDDEKGSFEKSTVEARSFQPRAGSGRLADIDDAIGITLVEVSSNGRSGTFTTIDLDDIVATSMRGGPVWRLKLVNGSSFNCGRNSWVRVTPDRGWGWESVPSRVAEATLLQAARLVKRRDAPEGHLGFDGTGITMMSRQALDPDAAQLVHYLRHPTRWAP